MKRIAILTCLKATGACSGASCFNAFNKREKTFEAYKDDDVEICAFFHCNGCDYDYENDEKYKKKLDRICDMKLDAVHKGVCTSSGGEECHIISKISEAIEASGAKLIMGTH